MTLKNKYIKASEALGSLPPERSDDLCRLIDLEIKKRDKTIVVLDDDPTGTQTVHGVYVLTDWSVENIEKEFRNKTRLFYILTNSRSLTVSAANTLATGIGENLIEASGRTGRDFLVVSRSDSTLRGHYPYELDALSTSIHYEKAISFLVPAFFEGGRYTIDNVHYILENEQLVPVSDTPFAADKTFGFKNANLKKYVEEKTNGRINANEVYALTIEELRSLDVNTITSKIASFPDGSVCIVNAASYHDLEVFALAMYRSGREVLLRSAASIVPVLAGIDKKPLLDAEYFNKGDKNGVLVIVGSYVPKTTTQLERLQSLDDVTFLELDLSKMDIQNRTLRAELAGEIDRLIRAGRDVVMYTSRKLLSHRDPEKSLLIGQNVSRFITGMVRSLNEEPRAMLAKGGITSSDVATEGLGVKKALVAGQVAPGVPVWELGEEAKFPQMIYIVFPGNVGSDDTLREVFVKVASR